MVPLELVVGKPIENPVGEVREFLLKVDKTENASSLNKSRQMYDKPFI